MVLFSPWKKKHRDTRTDLRSPPLLDEHQGLKAGVVTGEDYKAVVDHAIKNGYAIPAVNCTMSTVTNACLEAAK